MFGFLNIDKPKGMTSHDVVAQIRRWLKERGYIIKVGHAGTLDPLATGVLIICLGAATRLSDYVMHQKKLYRAQIHLGIATDTYDAEGAIIAEQTVHHITLTGIKTALASFIGSFEQMPPMYSAIKQRGRKLYELARAGQYVARQPRAVVIDEIIVEDWSNPILTIDVRCSAGTYVRSLAHDLGEKLDVGGHLSGLRRLASGKFRIENAISLETLAANADWSAYIISPLTPFDEWLKIGLSTEQERAICHGQLIARDSDVTYHQAVAVNKDGQLVAILRAEANRYWKPHKVFLNL